MFLDFIKFEICGRLETLAKTQRLLESHIQDAKNIAHSLLPDMPEIPVDANEEDVAQAFHEHDSTIWWHQRQFDIELPRFIRQSFLSRLYSLFEWSAPHIASVIRDRKKLTAALSSNTKKPITDRFTEFLAEPGVLAQQLNVAIDIEPLNVIRAIRNCTTHNDGRAADVTNARDKRCIETLLAARRGVSLTDDSMVKDPDEWGLLWIEERYCYDAHAEVSQFVTKVMNASQCFG